MKSSEELSFAIKFTVFALPVLSVIGLIVYSSLCIIDHIFHYVQDTATNFYWYHAVNEPNIVIYAADRDQANQIYIPLAQSYRATHRIKAADATHLPKATTESIATLKQKYHLTKKQITSLRSLDVNRYYYLNLKDQR